MNIARTRIRRVRMKAGGAPITVLDTSDFKDRIDLRFRAVKCIDSLVDGKIAGMAMVVWAADGTSTAVLTATARNHIPLIAMPEFVKNRLFAEKIDDWSWERTY